eukprot:CCRYP_006215-RA/>CCRYP_006215-RA protein AED:0.03 eAED:0.03 QI:3561/1/1/1/0.75/0.8/5/123/541
MDQRLRQRGWSIQSASDDPSNSHQRARAESSATEPSLSHEEKVHLMNSAFEEVNDDVEIVVPTGKIKRDSESIEEGDNYVAIAGEEKSADGDDESNDAFAKNPKKRRKTESSGKKKNYTALSCDSIENDAPKQGVALTQVQQDQFDLAKSKLSKWAARLFDPNRPRGLVEPPKTIPLNDEFLTAFGKREKEYDELSGRKIDIDKTSLDVVDIFDSDDGGTKSGTSKSQTNYSEISAGKVKITNLNYATSAETLTRACEMIGPVINVNIILDEYRQSTGRAYVVFEDHNTAQNFVDKMNEQSLDGRAIRASLSAASSSSRKKDGPNGGGVKRDNRYWERDISKKCNHCGIVGHLMTNCPNGDDQFKPCPMCAEVGHDLWSCPLKSVCFNCGVPGHVSRECPHRRMNHNRMICTICHARDHHRFSCSERPWNVPSQDALCMECGKVGHLMCSEMKWFFGLTGLTCFNCGRSDHHGTQCQRPSFDQCARDSSLAQKEVEMADAINLSDQLSHQQNRSNASRDRDSMRERNNGRARSATPRHRRF